MFQFVLVPTINKPTRVTNKAIFAVDHIIANTVCNNNFNTAIIRIDISDHFPIAYAFKLRSSMSSENRRNNSYTVSFYKNNVYNKMSLKNPKTLRKC